MKLRTGDHITTPGSLGIAHHGIVDARGRGGSKVVHASKTGGVIVSSVKEFAGGNSISLVKEAEPGSRIKVANRAREALGEPYDLFSANCEHLAFGASHEVETSPQLRSVMTGATLGGGALLMFSGIAAEEGGGGRVVAGAALIALGLLFG